MSDNVKTGNERSSLSSEENKKLSISYRVMDRGCVRGLEFKDGWLIYSFDGIPYERRYNRRPCDFHNAASSIRKIPGVIILP